MQNNSKIILATFSYFPHAWGGSELYVSALAKELLKNGHEVEILAGMPEEKTNQYNVFYQDGFIKVFEKIGKFNFIGSLEGWIRRIMVNNAIDHYRKHKKRFVMSETLIQIERIADEEIEENIFDELTAKDLLAFVQQLSPVYRTVFNLYVLDGYSHAEISEELGISEGTSKSNLSKAKKNLKYMILQNIKNEK